MKLIIIGIFILLSKSHIVLGEDHSYLYKNSRFKQDYQLINSPAIEINPYMSLTSEEQIKQDAINSANAQIKRCEYRPQMPGVDKSLIFNMSKARDFAYCSSIIDNTSIEESILSIYSFKNECDCIEKSMDSKNILADPLNKREAVKVLSFLKNQEINNHLTFFTTSYSNLKLTEKMYDMYNPAKADGNDVRCNSMSSIIQAAKKKKNNDITNDCTDSIIKKIGIHNSKNSIACINSKKCNDTNIISTIDNSTNMFINKRLRSYKEDDNNIKTISYSIAEPIADLAKELYHLGYPIKDRRNHKAVKDFYNTIDKSIKDEMSAISELLKTYPLFNFDSTSPETDLKYIMTRILPNIDSKDSREEVNAKINIITGNALNKLMNKTNKAENCNNVIDTFKDMCNVVESKDEILTLKLDLNKSGEESRQQLLETYSKNNKNQSPLPLRKYLCHLENQYTDTDEWTYNEKEDYDASDDGKKNITFKGKFLTNEAQGVLNRIEVLKLNSEDHYIDGVFQAKPELVNRIANRQNTQHISKSSGNYSHKNLKSSNGSYNGADHLVRRVNNILSPTPEASSKREVFVKQREERSREDLKVSTLAKSQSSKKERPIVVRSELDNHTSYETKLNNINERTFIPSDNTVSQSPNFDSPIQHKEAMPNISPNIANTQTKKLQDEIIKLKKKLEDKEISKDEIASNDNSKEDIKSKIELQQMKLKLTNLELQLAKEKAKNKAKQLAKNKTKPSNKKVFSTKTQYKNAPRRTISPPSNKVYSSNNNSSGPSVTSSGNSAVAPQRSYSGNNSKNNESLENQTSQYNSTINKSSPQFNNAVLALSTGSQISVKQNKQIQTILQEKYKSYTGPYFDGEKYIVMFKNTDDSIEAKFLSKEEYSVYIEKNKKRELAQERTHSVKESTDIQIRQQPLSDLLKDSL